MNLKEEIKMEKMDNIAEANLNIPKPTTKFSHLRIPVNPKVEITNDFMEELSQNYNNQILIKEAPALNEWPTFTGEGEYDHMSFIKTIDILKEDYAIPDQLIAEILH
ncbi:hypothetical protein O181_089328 [Austropuccinia psidii MF-1]|uniref:Uncharacterized protein n=1 Tax=Austropuccinia psidii MF-1 TaxID=1389203 RepID=A0A9Q3ITA8_9BASI|nr:hypothetical protein [Austropuccinia psidii MF-1]